MGPCGSLKRACTEEPVNAAIRHTSRQVDHGIPLAQTAFCVPSTVSVRLANAFTIQNGLRKPAKRPFIVEKSQNRLLMWIIQMPLRHTCSRCAASVWYVRRTAQATINGLAAFTPTVLSVRKR